MTIKKINVSKYKAKSLTKNNNPYTGFRSKKHLIKARKNWSKHKKLIKGGGNDIINGIQLIGKGEFGCAFKKDNNIIKISLLTEENTNELDINKFLEDTNKKHPELCLSQKISILINYAIYTYKKKSVLIEYNEGYNGYKDELLTYINMCNFNLNSGFNLNSIGDKKFLIQEMPNAGNSLSSYIEKLLKNEKNETGNIKTYTEIIDILKIIINKSLSALKVLHSLTIVHRDIHLDNILIDTQGDCRIIDFGNSSRLTVKDDILNPVILNPVIDNKFINKYAPDFSTDCVFLLDDTELIFCPPVYIHNYNKENMKIELEKCKLVKKDNIKYFNDITNLFKLDLYKFGYRLDLLLYPKYDEHYILDTREFIRNTPSLKLDGIIDYGIIDTFIKRIANINYLERQLLYEI